MTVEIPWIAINRSVTRCETSRTACSLHSVCVAVSEGGPEEKEHFARTCSLLDWKPTSPMREAIPGQTPHRPAECRSQSSLRSA